MTPTTPARASEREAERGMEAAAEGRLRAREVRVDRARRHPRRLARLEHPPGKALAGREDDPLAERLELLRALARRATFARSAGARRRAALPDRAELPPERRPDRREDRRVHLDRPVGFREDRGDRVLDALKVTRAGERSARPLDVRHGRH